METRRSVKEMVASCKKVRLVRARRGELINGAAFVRTRRHHQHSSAGCMCPFGHIGNTVFRRHG